MSERMEKRPPLLPFQTIKDAVAGDPASVAVIVRHFGGYMTRMSERVYLVYGGGSVMLPDPEIRDELVIRLIEAIRKFKL